MAYLMLTLKTWQNYRNKNKKDSDLAKEVCDSPKVIFRAVICITERKKHHTWLLLLVDIKLCQDKFHKQKKTHPFEWSPWRTRVHKSPWISADIKAFLTCGFVF